METRPRRERKLGKDTSGVGASPPFLEEHSSQHCSWRGDSQPLVQRSGRNPHRHADTIAYYIFTYSRGDLDALKKPIPSFKADATRSERPPGIDAFDEPKSFLRMPLSDLCLEFRLLRANECQLFPNRDKFSNSFQISPYLWSIKNDWIRINNRVVWNPVFHWRNSALNHISTNNPELFHASYYN